MRRYVHDKIGKTKALLKNEGLKEYVPRTKKLTRESLRDMLHEYKMIYLKPNIGAFGNGVIRAEWRENDSEPYRYHSGLIARSCESFEQLYKSLRKEMGGRRYLVQQGIHLLKHRGRRFDLRVMVQKNPRMQWETTGIIGRVAAAHKVVTNYHNGGRLVPVGTLLAPYVPRSEKGSYIGRLSVMGRRIAKQLQQVYPGIQEIGVDVALDKGLHPWVLEVNTAPDPYIFRKLKNKRIFAKVIRYRRWIDSKRKRK
jgi:glutathione synthase/RimK-type ligase-like ATP-grasp enzyme